MYYIKNNIIHDDRVGLRLYWILYTQYVFYENKSFFVNLRLKMTETKSIYMGVVSIIPTLGDRLVSNRS